MSFDPIDLEQAADIANLARKIEDLETRDVQLQSLIVTEGKSWRNALQDIDNSLADAWRRINDNTQGLISLEDKTRKAFEIAEGVDKFLTDELVNLTQRVTDIVAANKLLDPNPSGTGATPPNDFRDIFKFPDLGSFLPGVGAGAILAGGAVLAFLLLTRRGR